MAEKINTPLYLIVGKSGSGKTSIANYIQNSEGLKQVESYTTRAPRCINEKGHIFLYPMTTETAMQAYPDRVAETFFDDAFYFVTPEQLKDAWLYVIDPAGVEDFKDNYKGSKPYYVVYVKCGLIKRLVRMVKRGDGLISAVRRILHDRNCGFDDIEETADLVVVNDKTIPDAAYKIIERIHDDILKSKIQADIAKAKAEKQPKPINLRTENIPEVK